LSFSRTDSNLLASGASHGGIKVWNVNEQACIHSFESDRGFITSLFFAGGAYSTCISVAFDGSSIRVWRAEGSSDFASETICEADGRGPGWRRSVFSASGSFLATTFHSYIGNDSTDSTLTLYELETMTKTQSVLISDFIAVCVAMSPDNKHLVVGDHTRRRIRIFQVDDFSIQRDLETRGEPRHFSCCAFVPTCRVLFFGPCRGVSKLELLTL
jgi:WD40 repeat protein